MSRRTAHILEQKWRSDDIRSGEDADFSSLLLPKEILRGLENAGFKYPSPIQLKAIPVGKIGKDLIVQAKSGTGKTIVFTVVALNMLLKGASHPQVLVMAPTREIAFQISQVFQNVGCGYKGLRCEYFIGGRRMEEDVPRIQGCQVVVGTPGRIKQLINYKVLKTAGIRLFVLDEADQLLKESSFTTDIDDIFRALPKDKQIIATSATYPSKLKRLTNKYFRDPLLIRLNKNDIGLLGMVHYYHVIPVSKLPVVAYKEKLKILENVLLSIKFAQCLVFCNMVSRVENLCVEIKNWGFATSYISSAREQEDRLKAIELLKRFKCKVLVSSDVSSRGIDAENVDLVINFDMPSQLDTYFHRVGRAGRYGSKCASVTFITSDEIEVYQQMQTDGKFESYPLPDVVPEGLISLHPKIKHSVENKELPLDDGSESSSDSSSDKENLNENGIIKKEKANGFSEDVQTNGNNELSCISESEEFVSENLVKPSDEKLVEVTSTESNNSLEKQNQFLDFNSNPTNSVKEDGDLSSTSESVDLEFDKIDSPASVNLKQSEVITDVSPSSEIVVVEDENMLEVNKSNSEESCKNNRLTEKNSDQENLVTIVEENTENCQPKSVKLAGNINGLPQITDTTSCLVVLENDKTIDSKSFVMSNEFSSSESFNNPKSKDFFSSVASYIQGYENCHKGSEELSTADCTKSSPSNDNKFSPESLKHYRSSLSKYHYNVHKAFIVNFSENLIYEKAQDCGIEKHVNTAESVEQTCLIQNRENKIRNSSLDSQLTLFSTPKAGTTSSIKSDDSSGLESSSGSDKNKLIEHFNSRLSSIRKVKPFANQNSTSESSSNSESNSDSSLNSEDAMDMLTKEFNKVSQEKAKCFNKRAANIINHLEEESSSSSSSSDSGTSIDSGRTMEELEHKFTELIKAKRSNGGLSKDTEETKKILHNIQCTKKCYKSIRIVDAKKHAESSTDTSSDSDISTDSEETKKIQNTKKCYESSEIIDTKKHAESSTSTSVSDTSIDSGKVKDEPQKQVNRRMQNVKSKVFTARKFSESSSKTKTESDVDLYSKETSGLQEGQDRRTCKKGKPASKTDPSCRVKTTNRHLENKFTNYYSKTNATETETDIDQYSKQSSSNLEVDHQNKRKNRKKEETVPKTGPYPFDYSNANGISNPYHNPASERPIVCTPHFNHQIQPPYSASNPYNMQYSQQRQNHADQGPFGIAHFNYQMQPSYYASNPYYPSYPQQIQNHANGQFLSSQSGHHHMQPTCVPNPLSQPYPSECPFKESCQMRYNLAGSEHTVSSTSQRNSNPSANKLSNHLIQPSQYPNYQCAEPSQHLCHLPNETCQSPACAAWYDIFYKQWQFLNQAPYF